MCRSRTLSPKAKMIKDLKKLEADNYTMREKISSGVSLKNPKALSFDTLEEVASNAAVAKVYYCLTFSKYSLTYRITNYAH